MSDEYPPLPGFKVFERNGLDVPEGNKTIHARQNWVLTQNECPKGAADIFGLGQDLPEPGDVINMTVGRMVRFMHVTEVEQLSHPSNYDWRARCLFGGGYNPTALSKLNLDKL